MARVLRLSTMYRNRWSASSHTASVACGTKLGSEPKNGSYHAKAAS
jgi:hypothetical protein